MTNEAYKRVDLRTRTLHTPSLGALRANSAMDDHPVHNAMMAQDTVVCASRRVVADVHLSGHDTWIVDGSVDPDAAGTQYYPDPTTWRVMATNVVYTTPGCFLEAHVVYVPSGMTETDTGGGNFLGSGTHGAIRVGATWTNGVNTTGPHYFGLNLVGSQRTFGAPPTAAGSEWTTLQEGIIQDIRPPNVATDKAQLAKYSEWPKVTITIERQGGARPVHVIVYETVFGYAVAHNDADPTSLHVYSVGSTPPKALPTAKPLEDAPDGATNQEDRFGTKKALEVALQQTETIGPRLAHWTSFNHLPADRLTTENPPVTTASTTFLDLPNLVDSTWPPSSSGGILGAPYSGRYRDSAERLILRGKAAAVPVTINVRCSSSAGANDGTIRFQTSDESYIDIPVNTGGAIQTIRETGTLEAQLVPDQTAGHLGVYIKAGSGQTISVYDWSIDYGWAGI